MSTLKRKRTYGPQLGVVMPYMKPAQKQKRRKKGQAFVPGRDRTGGYYGRYTSGGDGEQKFFDVDLDDAAVDAAGTVTDSINKIAQGVTEVQRVGRKCTIKSINWHYRTYLPEAVSQATPQGPDIVRIMLFLDKQCNGATAAVTDILETANFQSFRNLANSGRFNILLDKSVALNYPSSGGWLANTYFNPEVTRPGAFYKKCSIPIEFSSTTGAIGEIRSNNLGVLLISNNGVAGFESAIRLRFAD